MLRNISQNRWNYAHLIVWMLFFSTVPGQGVPSGGAAGGSGRIEGNFKFMPIPYLNYNRSLGFTLGALPMVMFNPVADDTLSPSSVGSLLGMDIAAGLEDWGVYFRIGEAF